MKDETHQGQYFQAQPTDPDFEAKRKEMMTRLQKPIGKAHPEEAVAFDKDLAPRDNSSLLHRAKLLHADMIQRCAEDDQEVSRIEDAFGVLYLFLGGDR